MTAVPSPLVVGDHTMGIISMRDGGPDTVGLSSGGRALYCRTFGSWVCSARRYDGRRLRIRIWLRRFFLIVAIRVRWVLRRIGGGWILFRNGCRLLFRWRERWLRLVHRL